MKFFRFFIMPVTLAVTLFAGFSSLQAKEEDNGLVIIDRKPWKVSWVEESNQWVLLTHFDEGELKTYFKKAPPKQGLGVDSENKPIKQEFKYYPSGKTYTSKKSQFEQWPDGAKAWAFSYDVPIKIEGDQFLRNCTTAIIQEVDGKPDEIRYAFVRGL